MSVAKYKNGTVARPSQAERTMKAKPSVLITGGAGFIGTNLANRLLSEGIPVRIYDNLSRPGVKQNWVWLRNQHGELVQLWQNDIRDCGTLKRAVRDVSQVFHFAAQVAVTTSLVNPVEDFEINARGTLNLLEALRTLPAPPSLIYTSTNKIYGELANLKLRAGDLRYEPASASLRRNGLKEATQLEFHSPYGCSKGAACQYVLDYARTFGLPALVFCMSCIYGPHQFGNEDQGWVAHFLIRALRDLPINIYGDGKQVRDILFVDDLVDALMLAHRKIHLLAGQAFNIGGGPKNTLSLLELLDLISELSGDRPQTRFETWRMADQRYYVSDIRKFSRATGWSPATRVRTGVERLYQWLQTDGAHNQVSYSKAAGRGVSEFGSLSRQRGPLWPLIKK